MKICSCKIYIYSFRIGETVTLNSVHMNQALKMLEHALNLMMFKNDSENTSV